MIENESLDKLEYAQCQLEDITKMLFYVYEDYYVAQKNDLYTKADNYNRLGNFLINIHSLLYNQCEEMKEFINKVYEEKRGSKLDNSEFETVPFYNKEKNKIENIPVYNSIKMVDGKIVYS